MATPPPPLDSQLVAALARAAEIDAALGPPDAGVAGARRHHARSRRIWNEGGPAVAHVQEATVPGPYRTIPVVVYRAAPGDEHLPVFVYLHGGGFQLGDAWSNDRQMRELALAWGGVVISADYLHAPEHVFPAAVEETAAVLQWLHAHGATWRIRGEAVAVGGASAGAAVALGAAVHLRSPPWLRAAAGIVGAFNGDLTTASMRQYGDAGIYPDAASVPPLFDAYLPSEEMRSDPRANVLLADPKLLPPTFLAAAEYDVLRDASGQLAERLRSGGRLDTFKVYPGMTHLFFGYSGLVDRAAECVHDLANFLDRHLPASGASGHSGKVT